MEKIAVDLKNYSFKYSNTEKWVLNDVNFSLSYGELLVLSGMSGEGKSTLLSSINGIIPNIILGEQKGEVLIDGEKIGNKRPSEISCLVGSVLQNADSQIINSRVEDEIAFGCENLNMSVDKIEQQIEYASELMDLNKEWFTKTLSGGQKQRLITASILAMQQKILVFDEPLANLDLDGSQALLKVLRDLATKGYAILLIEHRLDIVLPYAHKVAWLKDGKVSIHAKKETALANTAVVPPKHFRKKKTVEPCFIAKELSYGVEKNDILQELNFTINKGERVVILGENGCGKTTLMKLLAKMLTPSEGNIEQFIDRKQKKKPSSRWFKKVGFVYQNPNYQLFMPKVIDEIRYQSKGELITQGMLKRLDLENLRDRHPQSLSEGQKRKLTVACVLAMEPEVILLDEPTVGQDYEGLKTIIDNLNEIHERNGNTIITITHDFRCASAITDKIIWMKKGRIYKIGGVELAEEYFKSNLLQKINTIIS